MGATLLAQVLADPSKKRHGPPVAYFIRIELKAKIYYNTTHSRVYLETTSILNSQHTLTINSSVGIYT
jgi:hypothetical protein